MRFTFVVWSELLWTAVGWIAMKCGRHILVSRRMSCNNFRDVDFSSHANILWFRTKHLAAKINCFHTHPHPICETFSAFFYMKNAAGQSQMGSHIRNMSSIFWHGVGGRAQGRTSCLNSTVETSTSTLASVLIIKSSSIWWNLVVFPSWHLH